MFFVFEMYSLSYKGENLIFFKKYSLIQFLAYNTFSEKLYTQLNSVFWKAVNSVKFVLLFLYEVDMQY